MEFKKIIFNSKTIFTENSNPVNEEIEILYLKCYNGLINKILNNNITLEKLIPGSPFIDGLTDYNKFHISSLLIDLGYDLDIILNFLSINIDKSLNVLKVYDTTNMWYTSNIHMGALSIISKSKNKNSIELAAKMIKELDRTNFSSTKWKYKGSINRIAAFYHYVPFIDRHDIHISEETLSMLYEDLTYMQNSLGSFTYPNGFSCIELDSVVVLAFLKKKGYDVSKMLELKLFNSQCTLKENGWSLYSKGQNKLRSFIELCTNISSIQDFLWNAKKIFYDVEKLQYDNGHKGLVSNSSDVTLMSNYFGLITYIQLINSLDIDIKNDIKKIKSYSLAYVV